MTKTEPKAPAKTKAPSRNPGGRPRGSRNVITMTLKKAILEAAMLQGMDGKGKDKLRGYLRMLARDEKKTFAALLGRVVPLQIEGSDDNPLQVIIQAGDAKIG